MVNRTRKSQGIDELFKKAETKRLQRATRLIGCRAIGPHRVGGGLRFVDAKVDDGVRSGTGVESRR